MDALEKLRNLAPESKTKIETTTTTTTACKARKVDIKEVRELLSNSAEYLKALAERDDNYYFFEEMENIGERIWEMFYPDC